MATFTTTTNPTPFGFFDTDTVFQSEADNMVTFVKRMLGDDVLSVELTKKQIWACLEESMLEYSSLINQYQTKAQLNSFLGQATGTLEGKEQLYPRENLEFLVRHAEPYAMEAGIGGAYDSVSGTIKLVPGRQDYDLYSELKDSQGNTLFDHPLNVTNSKMRIREVFHFSPNAAYRFFVRVQFTPDPTSALTSGLSGSISGSISDNSIFGVSNISNIPFGRLAYSRINSIARQWIRQFTLARSKELLGLIRSKFSSVPIPGGDLTLNGSDLISNAREEKEKLREELKEMLDSLTYDKLLEIDVNRAEAVMKQLRMVPMPNGMAIFTG